MSQSLSPTETNNVCYTPQLYLTLLGVPSGRRPVRDVPTEGVQTGPDRTAPHLPHTTES